MKHALRLFMKGNIDVEAFLTLEYNAYVAHRACLDARAYLAEVYYYRKLRKDEIQAERDEENRRGEFTIENFRVKIDKYQNRNFGAMNVSIYCIVEVWTDDDNVEKEYLVNYSDYKTKEWLTKLLVWGLMNKREILIKPATQTELTSMKMFVPKTAA